MPDQTDLVHAGAHQQAIRIRNGEVSSREVVAETLGRIEDVNPTLRAFRVVLSESAMADAARADERNAAGEALPLLGVPVAIKDNIDVAGELTTYGVAGQKDVAVSDAPVVSALKGSGAVIIGKTTCSELAVWPFTETDAFGATRNPWNTDFTTGGSSGGSAAAAAAGLCGVALGSDGLGSIRVPAAFNGVFGLKPQRGRILGSGGWHGLSVNGPISPNVADAALFMDATATSHPEGGFRISVAFKPLAPWPTAARLGDEQRSAVESICTLLRELGHEVRESELEFHRSGSTSVLLRYLSGVHESLQLLDDVDQASARTRQMGRFGGWISDDRLAKVISNEAHLAATMNTAFDEADVVLTPGPVGPPMRVGQLDGNGAVLSLFRAGRLIPHYGPWNVIGQPAMSIPAGFDTEGLPLAVHFAGRSHDEATLLSLAAQLEQARSWRTTLPLLGR